MRPVALAVALGGALTETWRLFRGWRGRWDFPICLVSWSRLPGVGMGGRPPVLVEVSNFSVLPRMGLLLGRVTSPP